MAFLNSDQNFDIENLSTVSRNSSRLNSRQLLKEKHEEIILKLEKSKFGWLHIKSWLISGIGFFTNAYQLIIINMVILMMGCIYNKNTENTVPTYIDTLVKASSHIGILFGQLSFGIAADKLGRKRIYGLELLIIVVSACASALAGSTVSGMSIYMSLGIWRFFLGFGIGGDYPLSATITSESSTTSRRGAMMAAIFAMQGFGIFGAALMAIILLAVFKQAIDQNQDNLDYVWRLCIGLGAIPPFVGIYFRFKISETPRYKMKLDKQADEPNKASFKEFYKHFSKWKNLKVLLGTSITWFCLDTAFYGINLNTSLIIESIGFSGDIVVDPWDALFKNSVGNLILSLLGIIPGFWVCVLLIDRWGRKPIQLIGFIILTVLFLVLGLSYKKILDTSMALFIIIFTLMQFFFTFGPNTTTFVIPGEVFPTRYRSTAHGISAAMGKLGAIISQVGFFQLRDIGGKNNSIPLILDIFAGFMFIGFLFTFFLPETKGKSLEELSEENHNSDNHEHSCNYTESTSF